MVDELLERGWAVRSIGISMRKSYAPAKASSGQAVAAFIAMSRFVAWLFKNNGCHWASGHDLDDLQVIPIT